MVNNMDFLSRSGEYLGSHFEITIPKNPLGNLDVLNECFIELKRIEQEYSRFLDSSELSKVNSNLNVWQQVNSEFIFLLKKSLEFNILTNGNFDITLKSRIEELGYDKDYSFKEKTISKSNVFQKAISKVKNMFTNSIIIDEKNSKIFLRKEIEFGGFGKGYCLDRLSEILESKNIFDYQINAGGDIYSKKGDVNDFWTIVLEHPDDETKVIGQIKLNGLAIAGSAPNRRKWGKYHHLLNAKTRLPQNSVKCIFVLAHSGIEADAYSTSLFSAGFKEGIELSKKLPVEILMISKDNEMYVSSGFNVELFE